MLKSSGRIESVDSLRGFAVLGMLMLHFIEQFYFQIPLISNGELSQQFDWPIWHHIHSLLSGRVDSIFALLFGFSFYIQYTKHQDKGYDFRLRFLWRLFILFIFGILNTLFYVGDILVSFSILAISLVLIARLNTKTIILILFFLTILPLSLLNNLYELFSLGEYIGKVNIDNYGNILNSYINSNSFFDTAYGNIIYGKPFMLINTWNSPQANSIIILFLLGFILGRAQLFVKSSKSIKFWSITLLIASLFYFSTNGLNIQLEENTYNKLLNNCITASYSIVRSLSHTIMLVALFFLIYSLTSIGQKILDKLSIYGKMSLTNYISQSVIGTALFYSWGLGLKNEFGVTYSLLLGILVFLLQYCFCYWWSKKGHQPPLEFLWKRLTWIGYNKK